MTSISRCMSTLPVAASPPSLRISVALMAASLVVLLGWRFLCSGQNSVGLRLGGPGSGAQHTEQGGVYLAGVGTGDGARAGLDTGGERGLDQSRQAGREAYPRHR